MPQAAAVPAVHTEEAPSVLAVIVSNGYLLARLMNEDNAHWEGFIKPLQLRLETLRVAITSLRVVNDG